MIYPFAKTNSPQMKRIISGTAAVFLCATMFTGCFKKGGDDATQPSSGPNLVDTTPTESIASEPSTEATETTSPPTEASKVNVAVVKEQVNTLSSPTVDSNVLTTLNAGDEVSVNRVETIGAIQWAYIPLKGWVNTESLDMTNVTISGASSTPAGSNDSGAPTTTTAPSSTTGTTTGSGQTGTVTASELLIRQSPSTAATSVGKYTKGTQVTILESSNGWGRTDKGWINMGYVRLGNGTTNTATNTNTNTNTNTTTNTNTGTTTTAGGKKGVVTATQLNIRESAATTANRAGSYSYGDRITILETNNGWGRTDKGWVSMDYVYVDGTTGKNTAKGLVTGNGLNVRSGPGTNYNSVASYAAMTRVNILEQVKVGGTTWGCTKDGWISLSYVYIDGTTGDGAATGTISGSNVNIRSGPGTNYDRVGSYNSGDTVQVYAQFTVGNMKWGCTSKGWVSMDYVEVG